VATGTEIVTDLFRWWEELMKKNVLRIISGGRKKWLITIRNLI